MVKTLVEHQQGRGAKSSSSVWYTEIVWNKTLQGDIYSFSWWLALCSVVCSACGPTVSTETVFAELTMLTGMATTVLPVAPPTVPARFCTVAAVPIVGSVTSWNGLTTLTIVGPWVPSCTAAVLRTVRLEPSCWTSAPVGEVNTVYPLIIGDWAWADSTLSNVMPASWVIGRVKCVGCATVAGPETARVRRGRLDGGEEDTGVKVMRTLLRCCDLLFSSLACFRCSSHCCSRAIKVKGHFCQKRTHNRI